MSGDSSTILEPTTCVGCRFWAGTCLKGKIGRVANSEGCEQFMARTRLKGGKAPNG